MSTLRSLKKPKKHRKNIGYVVGAVLLIIAIILSIVLLSGKDVRKARRADIRTEIVQQEQE